MKAARPAPRLLWAKHAVLRLQVLRLVLPCGDSDGLQSFERGKGSGDDDVGGKRQIGRLELEALVLRRRFPGFDLAPHATEHVG